MPPGLYYRHESSLEHDTGTHPENAARIPAIEGELERRGWLGWDVREAPAAELDQITRVHPPDYVERIRELSESGGGWLDADTVDSPGSWRAALHAAGGACAMASALMGGDAGVGFSALRPPGHHAEQARAMGFCLFNNIAIAARHAIDEHGARRVAVFDWDVHHGNGTNDIFHASDEVLYVSIHQSPLYPGTGPLEDVGSGSGEGYTVNLPVPPGSGEDVWLSLTANVVVPVIRAFEPGLVLVSAGFDAHRDDPLAQCTLETESFARMADHVRALAQELDVPLGAVLEGGYDLHALAASVAATLEAFADGAEPLEAPVEDVTRRALDVVARHWPVAAA
jgi:acetoin utilization deacetylase AcuC-like enzyme